MLDTGHSCPCCSSLDVPPPSPPLCTFCVYEKEANMWENEVILLSWFLHEEDASSVANPHRFHQLSPATARTPEELWYLLFLSYPSWALSRLRNNV